MLMYTNVYVKLMKTMMQSMRERGIRFFLYKVSIKCMMLLKSGLGFTVNIY